MDTSVVTFSEAARAMEALMVAGLTHDDMVQVAETSWQASCAVDSIHWFQNMRQQATCEIETEALLAVQLVIEHFANPYLLRDIAAAAKFYSVTCAALNGILDERLLEQILVEFPRSLGYELVYSMVEKIGVVSRESINAIWTKTKYSAVRRAATSYLNNQPLP